MDCYICGDEPQMRDPNKYKRINKESEGYTILANGVDRYDNSMGYTLANSKPCCTFCNNAKHKYSISEFLSKINKIQRHQEKIGVVNG